MEHPAKTIHPTAQQFRLLGLQAHLDGLSAPLRAEPAFPIRKGKEPYIKYSSHFCLSSRRPEQPQHQKTFHLRRKDFRPFLRIRIA